MSAKPTAWPDSRGTEARPRLGFFTDTIQWGPVDEFLARAHARARQLHGQGVEEVRLYGADPVRTTHLPQIYRAAAPAAGALAAALGAVYLWGSR